MKKYTYKDWLKGKDQVTAEQKYIDPDDWKMVVEKQKKLYEKHINTNFNVLKADYLLALENSYDKELFIKSGCESLKMIFDTSYRESSQNLKPDKPTFYFRNIYFITIPREYRINDLRNDFYDLLEGRSSFHFIKCPNIEEAENMDLSFWREIFTGALYKLYKYIGEKYEDILQPKVKFIGEKIKWLGSPSQFGYIILELINNGFIELPIGKGNKNYARVAELCFEKFHIKTKISSLKKEISPSTNSLTFANKDAFKIPNIKDLS